MLSDETLDLLMRLHSSPPPPCSDHLDYNSCNFNAPCPGPSLSLKRIFEQINASCAAVKPTLAPSAHDLRNVHHQKNTSVHVNHVDLQLGGGGRVREEEEGSLVYIGSSASAATLPTTTAPFLKSSSSFLKSPSSFSGGNQSLPHHQLKQEETTMRSSHMHSTNPIDIAQLTIFYSGMVNVYDDVAADKVQAIMLLAAGSGNCSPVINNNLMADHNVKPAAAAAVALSTENAGINIIDTIRSSAPSPNITINIADAPRQRVLIKPSQNIAELPYARKASLARFLEKRRDRESPDSVVHPMRRASL